MRYIPVPFFKKLNFLKFQDIHLVQFVQFMLLLKKTIPFENLKMYP